MVASRFIPKIAGVIPVDDFLRYLAKHKRIWPIRRIVRVSGLPRSVVYRAIHGGNSSKKTLQKIAEVFGGEILVVIKEGQNSLLVDEADKVT